MITCVLNGRLGNQMFQIAATIATAQRYSVPYSIPRKTLNDWFPVYFDHLPCEPHSGRMLTCEEKANCYEEIKYSGRTLRLNGYFQSYKYFNGYREMLRTVFKMDELPQNLREHLGNYVSIHVRRGDYLQNPDFTVLDLNYYYNAITWFGQKGYRKFLLFSDDIPWCKGKINKTIFPGAEFSYSKNSELQDMQCMAACRHHIIANSSFSWWGAWLNNDPDRMVVCPDGQWFKGMNNDMVPNEWIKMG